MTWGMDNLLNTGPTESSYAIRHGSQPVPDFAAVRERERLGNLFEQAFPSLFPYGEGGIECQRLRGVNMVEHVQWALRFHDRRFRTHETFLFVAFGLIQRRQALASARIQVERHNFLRDANQLTSLSATSLANAVIEEERRQPPSDHAISALRKHTYAVASRVQGSDQSRIHLRSQIWSTSICLGPPSLWITINPCDLHDPIVQVFAGENIDVDNLSTFLSPNKTKRAENVAHDPYAAAKFFHFLIRCILESLFGITSTQFNIEVESGVLGRVAAYFGTVESQGRGSLHLHMLVYLKDAPTSSEMDSRLKQPSFRDKVVAYLDKVLCSDLPEIKTQADLQRVTNNVEVAWSRPPNPDLPADEYERELEKLEATVARAKQVHTCAPRRCLISDKQGRLHCKRNAPFPLADETSVDADGRWATRRQYPYLNGWIPAITINARCNNDGKLLTNGADTRNISFYVTTYQTKKQGKNYNMSAVMARGFAYHEDCVQRSQYSLSLRDQQRLMLFRVVHAINREQELAAPMVVSYLMGWGDTFRSHHYSPIYWSSFTASLLHSFPDLQRSNVANHISGQENPCQEQSEMEVRPNNPLLPLPFETTNHSCRHSPSL